MDDCKIKITIRHLLTMTEVFNWNEQMGYDDPQNDYSKMEASFDRIK